MQPMHYKRRRPSRARTAADDELRARLRDWQRQWSVGDRVIAPTEGPTATVTTIAAIDGETVTLATGDQLHITKVRGVSDGSD